MISLLMSIYIYKLYDLIKNDGIYYYINKQRKNI